MNLYCPHTQYRLLLHPVRMSLQSACSIWNAMAQHPVLASLQTTWSAQIVATFSACISTVHMPNTDYCYIQCMCLYSACPIWTVSSSSARFSSVHMLQYSIKCMDISSPAIPLLASQTPRFTMLADAAITLVSLGTIGFYFVLHGLVWMSAYFL